MRNIIKQKQEQNTGKPSDSEGDLNLKDLEVPEFTQIDDDEQEKELEVHDDDNGCCFCGC
jgi:hypothetical protein